MILTNIRHTHLNNILYTTKPIFYLLHHSSTPSLLESVNLPQCCLRCSCRSLLQRTSTHAETLHSTHTRWSTTSISILGSSTLPNFVLVTGLHTSNADFLTGLHTSTADFLTGLHTPMANTNFKLNCIIKFNKYTLYLLVTYQNLTFI